jgi:hypothetical protein
MNGRIYWEQVKFTITWRGDFGSTKYVFLYHPLFSLAEKRFIASPITDSSDSGVVTHVSPGGANKVTTNIKRDIV